jgi:hypothetical protein
MTGALTWETRLMRRPVTGWAGEVWTVNDGAGSVSTDPVSVGQFNHLERTATRLIQSI